MSQDPVRPTSPTHTSEAAAPDSVSRLLHHLDEVRQTRSADCIRLLNDVDGIRRLRQRECVRLLQELTPHLQAARMVERELDRHLARRFNTFRYLRGDELGLSRIIADLLDPVGEHGQGTTFLEAMLELLEVAPEASASGRSRNTASGRGGRAATLERLPGRLRSTADEKIRVRQERGTGGRFIDITVDIPTNDGHFCLAFENKPYAGDQHRQCRDYLEFLDKEYRGRFLLVYLPPRFRMPDESSLPRKDRERWRNHFRVLPYVADEPPLGDNGPSDRDGEAFTQVDSGEDHSFAGDDAPDHNSAETADDAPVADGTSLADWFGTCCKVCDAERLRWFLREAQLFCQHRFGESTMTDTEARYIRGYLDENPKHLHAAFSVFRAWPAVTHDACRRLLERLRDQVEERVRNEFPNIADDLVVACDYSKTKKKWSNHVCVYRSGWLPREGALDLGSDGRPAVVLTCHGGPKSWHWGVTYGRAKDNKKSGQERQRCDELEVALKRRGLSLPHGDQNWPQFRWSPRYEDWTVFVPEIVQELAEGGGKITEYYVNSLFTIAQKAIPAIDQVEQP